MSIRLKPPNDIPESRMASYRSRLSSEVKTRGASVPSTVIRPILTARIRELCRSAATSTVDWFVVRSLGTTPSSTPTSL
jgi:hypothetical protein